MSPFNTYQKPPGYSLLLTTDGDQVKYCHHFTHIQEDVCLQEDVLLNRMGDRPMNIQYHSESLKALLCTGLYQSSPGKIKHQMLCIALHHFIMLFGKHHVPEGVLFAHYLV